VIIGSVFGGLAGIAMIFAVLLFFLRWKKRHNAMLELSSVNRDLPIGGGAGDAPTLPDSTPSQPPGGMSQRRSLAFAVPAAFASLTGYNKRASQKTDRTISSTAGSERGFYRVSGRKLPSVLQSGGDGYGGGIDEPNPNTLSGTSFYRDSQGFYGGPSSTAFPNPKFPPLDAAQRDSGMMGTPIMRPSPARTPTAVTPSTEFGFPVPPTTPPPITPPRRPDLLGRSHPSQDGSHTSRFTEEV